jgi:sporulation protein YlmC with PRC-barrel domain
MKQHGAIDLGLGLLDHQLVDSDGIRCGNVDDLELEGVREGRPRVSAILVGPGALAHRGLLGRVWASLWNGRVVRVPWDEVEDVGAGVFLRRPAAELRLGEGDRRARQFVARLPGAKR